MAQCWDCGHQLRTTRLTEPDEEGTYLELWECPACDAAWRAVWWEGLGEWKAYRVRYPRVKTARCWDCGHQLKTTRLTKPNEYDGRYLELWECPACDAAWRMVWWEHQGRWVQLYRERYPRDHKLGGMGLIERLDYLKSIRPFRSVGEYEQSVGEYEQLALPLFDLGGR